MMIYSKISFFVICLFAWDFSYAYLLPVSPRFNLKLDEKTWQLGQGKLLPEGPTWNIYSNSKKPSQQIFIEEIYVPAKFAKDRLPKSCQFLLGKTESKQGDYCKITKTGGNKAQELSVIAIFKTSKKEILKFRTTFLTGNSGESETTFKSFLKESKPNDRVAK